MLTCLCSVTDMCIWFNYDRLYWDSHSFKVYISILISLSLRLSFFMPPPPRSLYDHLSHPILSEVSAHEGDGKLCQELQNPTAFPIPPGWIRLLC